MDLGHDLASGIGHDLVAAVGEANGAIFVVAVEKNGRADLMQEGEAGQQIIHQRLRPVWFVGITPSASAKAGEVNGIAQVDARLGFVAVKESQERFARAGVDVRTMATTKPDPFLPFAGDGRHEAAGSVKALS